MDRPNSMAKKMIGSTSPLASDSAGLVGMMLRKTVATEGASAILPLTASEPTRFMPDPGCRRLAKNRPSPTDKADVAI